MARTVNGKFIPTDIIAKTLIGTAPNGQSHDLMKIDQVDHFEPTGTISSFLRIQLNNDEETVQDSFFFPIDEAMELKWSFLQTTEANQILMDLEMMLIQDSCYLDCFIATLTKEYFQKELGYSGFQIVQEVC